MDDGGDGEGEPRGGNWIEPRGFGSGEGGRYGGDALVGKLLAFFEAKGLRRLKEEDAGEIWYEDWLGYQGEHGIYARLLVPRRFSGLESGLDLFRLTRFLEVFAYCSPAHGYSLQVSFLGFFSILMGTNDAVKREAARLLESGGVLAFGVSEQGHGADLLATELTLKETEAGKYQARGSKYYIGNANCAGMLAVLARKEALKEKGARARRAPLAMFVLRPEGGLKNLKKISTLGVRAAFVGSFEVESGGRAVEEADIFAEGREAWDAVFGAVTLGKFFLGFGSIGICERALGEATGHLRRRILFGKPATEMAHLKRGLAAAYARLFAMKLYAYRGLDYVIGATAEDRRYLLFNAVQKAKVSTEGVKVMAQLSQCVGAFGFETRTFFEMALRDIQLIPGLEGSGHINLGVTAQFLDRYFGRWSAGIAEAASLDGGEAPENGYLFEAKAGGAGSVAFPPCMRAYRGWMKVENVATFAGQVRAVRAFLRNEKRRKELLADGEMAILLGGILATIVYAQLVLEKSRLMRVGRETASVMFQLLVEDLSAGVLGLSGMEKIDVAGRAMLMRAVNAGAATAGEWACVSAACQKLAHTAPG